MTKFLIFDSNIPMFEIEVIAHIVNSGHSYGGYNINHVSSREVVDALKEDAIAIVIFSSLPASSSLIKLVELAIASSVPIIVISDRDSASGLRPLLDSVGYKNQLIRYYPEVWKEDFDTAIKNIFLAKLIGRSYSRDITSSVALESELDHREEVYFTACHPKEARVDSWCTLLIYTHILSALEKVQQDMQRFKDRIDIPKEITAKSSTHLSRGTEITIAPYCEGVTFNPETISFKWLEDFHRADFHFKADQSLSGDAAKGQIDIFAGSLIIGSLKFVMLFDGQDVNSGLDRQEYVKMYGKDDIFISYSRKDTNVVRTFKAVLSATGLDVFLDVDDLRSGQLWEKELFRRIECAKIFQMFWSENYSQSENCRVEWEYALKQNKEEGYIRPVYWRKPLFPSPPAELNKFNFRYVDLPDIEK